MTRRKTRRPAVGMGSIPTLLTFYKLDTGVELYGSFLFTAFSTGLTIYNNAHFLHTLTMAGFPPTYFAGLNTYSYTIELRILNNIALHTTLI